MISEQPRKDTRISRTPARVNQKLTLQWCLVAGYVAVMFALVPFALTLWTWLYQRFGLLFLYLIPGIGLMLFILLCSLILSGEKTRRMHKLTLLTAIFAGYGFLFHFFIQAPLEHFHLLEYGLLSYILYQPLSANSSCERILVRVILLLMIVGVADEIIQWILPYRCFDMRDIFLNSVSGILGFFLTCLVDQPRPGEGT
ncbi:MAG TPA: VanZ family protein [Thermodesulfobacteriota bacterium]|nr:VanZ family protein [Deltaproteobacteria bacterium]HNR13586.1 VanZ family protein [Thermodesulfobacteriota bacterium]HNU72767.1 VanZ family protein [Thermodesulfobacteriota bacterium]HOC38818.1 VanZ family protein [Thermodesulfobacteriota bacterium]HQO78341.1 VanZ family protein [Thermodesulfobacteriota bacterium]